MTASSMVFGFLRKATNPAYYGAQHMKVVNYFRQANLKSDGNPIFYGFLIAMFGAYFVDYTGKIRFHVAHTYAVKEKALAEDAAKGGH